MVASPRGNDPGNRGKVRDGPRTEWTDQHHHEGVTMKKGMNPEAVQQMATQITSAGEDVSSKYEAAAGRVQELDWTGEDADRYRGEFTDQIGQLVQQVVQGAQDFADRATQNAQQQTETSSQ